jgi:hypothetical protein
MSEDRDLKKIERKLEWMARWIFWGNQRLVYNSDWDAAKERGWQVGFIEGCMAMQGKIACKMIEKCYSLEEIKAITGLSSKVIKKFRGT